MKQKSREYHGFTMLELLLVTVIIWIIFPIMIEVYGFIIKTNREIIARQNAIQQWYEFFEKLNILMQDYTIDYEEYFNRQMVWCVDWWGTWSDFKWNVWTWWYCTEFTAYWNENSTNRKIDSAWAIISWSYHDIYYCTTENGFKNGWYQSRVEQENNCWKIWNKQSFGQYAAFFQNVESVGGWNRAYSDEWKPVNDAIKAIADDKNIQELYLISHDGKSRLFLRRKLYTWDNDYYQYKIQMLRLRWFDAWREHNFDKITEWSYDWKIDTWACDTSMWFVWSWASISWAYEEYRLPSNKDDCWVDLTYWTTNIMTRNLSISPTWDPDLYWLSEWRQINPYMKILIVNGVYLPWNNGNSITNFNVPIETSINMKDFYRE